MDAEFLKSLEPPKEEKQGDQRYVELTAEESEWVKSLINPKWKENDANNTEKYNKERIVFPGMNKNLNSTQFDQHSV